MVIKVKGHQHWWLAGGYDLEIGYFLEVDSMVVSWWIVAFLPRVMLPIANYGQHKSVQLHFASSGHQHYKYLVDK